MDRTSSAADSRAALLRYLCLGGAAALAIGLAVLPWEVITGQGVFWHSQVSDRAAALIGYYYYVHDVWRWPLYAIGTLNLPLGTSVIYTDSIPLLALAMKALAHVGVAVGNPYGAWLLACYALNGAAIALVLWHADVRSVPLTVLAALLAALTPVLLHRSFHFALCGQFVLLLSLACYAAAGRARTPRAATYAAAIVVASLNVHPYLGAMTLALYLATLGRAVAAGQAGMTAPRAAAHAAGTLAILALIAWALGYVDTGSSTVAAEGYGLFSANALSPVASSLSGMAPAGWERLRAAAAAASPWPFFYRAWPDGTGGQYYEGFGYFGAGLLLLVAVQIPWLVRNRREVVREHWPMIAMLVVVALFALSNRIYVGTYLLVDVPMTKTVEGLAGVFRSSGRFQWVLVYVALAASVVLAARRFGPRKALAVMAVALALQWIDTSPLRQALAIDMTTTNHAGVESPEWAAWLERDFDRLYIVPSHQCGDASLGNRKLALQYLVARHGPLPSNSASIARGRTACADEPKLVADAQANDRHAWLFFRDGLVLPEVARFMQRDDVECRVISDIHACAMRMPR